MSSLPSFEERVGAIEAEAGRLAAVVGDSLDREVPSCPGWTGADLAAHVARVFTFWAHQLASGDPSERHEPPPFDPDDAANVVEWLDASTGVLVGALGELGPDEPCWNWSGSELDSGWVARRMALESAVHRVDGEHTVGAAGEVACPLAVDGIDERLEVHLRVDVPENPEASLGGPLCLCCSDADAAWVVEIGGGRLRLRPGSGPAAAVLRARASDLFLFTWNRVGLERLELTGDSAVAAAWSSLPV